MGDKKEASYEETRPEIGGLGRRFCVGGREKLVTKNRGQECVDWLGDSV